MTSSSSLAPALDLLAAELRAQGSPLTANLAPGVPRDVNQSGPGGLVLPHELREWWAWRNGRLDGGGYPEHTLGDWLLLSIAEAETEYQDARRLAARAAQDGESPDVWWPRHWLPIAIAGNGDLLAVDCAAAPHAHVYVHAWEEPWHRPRLDSMFQLVGVWLRALQTGALRYDSQRPAWQVAPAVLEGSVTDRRFL